MYLYIYICMFVAALGPLNFSPSPAGSLWEHGPSGNLGVFESVCHPTPEAFSFSWLLLPVLFGFFFVLNSQLGIKYSLSLLAGED